MSKCNNCGASLESSSFIDGNTLKCNCGANIHNEVKYVEKVPFMKSIFSLQVILYLIIRKMYNIYIEICFSEIEK